MKNLKTLLLAAAIPLVLFSCNRDNEDNPVANDVTLHFNNTFKTNTIVLGDATSTAATVNTSANGQVHHFSEVKYIISNIRLMRADGTEFPYNINDLDNGATIVDHSKPASLNYVLSNIPAGEYKQIKFGLGIKKDLNTLDQVRFPKFYAAAEKNDTEMHWEWGTGYRFTKLEGFYDTTNKQLSIHTGSTVTDGPGGVIAQGVDAYRDITLDLPAAAVVGRTAPKITINADFDKLLSGKSENITLSTGFGFGDNATPNIHTADQMVRFVNNLGGNGTTELTGMFSILKVEN